MTLSQKFRKSETSLDTGFHSGIFQKFFNLYSAALSYSRKSLTFGRKISVGDSHKANVTKQSKIKQNQYVCSFATHLSFSLKACD